MVMRMRMCGYRGTCWRRVATCCSACRSERRGSPTSTDSVWTLRASCGTSPVTQSSGLFGLNTVPEDAKSVVITEGEFDSMAVYEATSMAAISLPFGANHLPLEALPWLEKFERIYLWLDSDEIGKAAAEKFAQKLGVKRTLIVNTMKDDPKGPKDANDALREGRDLLKYIKEAKPLIQENILTFRHIKEEVIKRIMNYESNKGVLSSFEWFNKKLKGFRKGELTVLTGGTGSGKTTFLSQWSLDFMEKGIPTLWGSFEIRNEVLASNMLMQFAKKNLIQDPSSIELFSRDFESLPLYFLNFYGSTPIDQMLNTLDYAVYAFDVGHIIIDNLQFMLSGQARGTDKFDLQDSLISKLRDFATSNKVHITVVIHPKKVDEDHQDLSISSVFGTAKATQEADNIFIIQNRFKYRLLDVRKNRFDGETGRVGLGYDKNTKRFSELTDSEVEQLNKSAKTVDDIFQARAMNTMAPIEEKKSEPIVAKKQSSLDDLVEQDISYYGSIAKTVASTASTIAEKLISLKKSAEAKVEMAVSSEHRPEDIVGNSIDKAVLRRIIEGGIAASSGTGKGGMVEEVAGDDKAEPRYQVAVEPSRKVLKENIDQSDKKVHKAEETEMILNALKNKKQSSIVEDFDNIPNEDIYPDPEAELKNSIEIPKTKDNVAKDEEISFTMKETKEEPLNVKDAINEVDAEEKGNGLKVIGYSEWMEDEPKRPAAVVKTEPRPTQKDKFTSPYEEKVNTVFTEKKKAFGQSYSSSKPVDRKKLFEVLRANGYMTSKSKGRYGKSSSDVSSSKP
eukprot:TRINITY_DN387_c0_g1_i13.p1 TRINITY_DN387_c0_g1~~TRINITY_DN387_c0_g1_i13.p1  ORF type:complete len:791 (+),score=198.92 TRINITY_DN387_c0_g1_i13:903-3275(+)